jgi:hypothetical protein
MGSAVSLGEQSFPAIEVDENIVRDPCTCPHPYLFCWDGVFVCMDCYYKLNDCEEAKKKNVDRIQEEEQFMQTVGDDCFC